MKKTTFTALAAATAWVLSSLSFITPNKENVEIVNVQHLPVKQGYAAIITYKNQDGTTGNYGIFSGVQLNLSNGAALNTEMRDGKVKISCAGTCTCHLSTTINTDTGVITVDCGCSSCSAQVSQS